VHVFLEWFVRRSGMDAVHVPYRGSAAAHPDLLAGRIAFTIDTWAAVRQYVEADRLRLLAFGGPARSGLRPEVPTIAEETGIPGYEANSWGGVLAPAGTPEAVVRRLNEGFGRILQAPETGERLLAMGAERVGGTPDAFRATMEADARRYTALVREFDIRLGA
jgi:tripartite-type tricarboxylate transporter receptor subunit TctC